MRYVGPLQYARLLDAREHFEKLGFKYVDVPWTVSREAVLLTRPPWISGEPFSYVAGGEFLYPVASAEQSFIQMQLDALAVGDRIKGNYCAITPCFRSESVLDDLHQPYFMKLELISWDDIGVRMHEMIAGALLYLRREHPGDHPGEDLKVGVVENNDPDSLAMIQAYDIVTTLTGIELGSYGVREHAKVGRWAYGTGLAEPRYSYALEEEKSFLKPS